MLRRVVSVALVTVICAVNCPFDEFDAKDVVKSVPIEYDDDEPLI